MSHMSISSTVQTALTAFALFVAVGCATTTPVQKLYDGPDRPAAEVASVIAPYTINIKDINGTEQASPARLRSSKEQRLELLPGSYVFGFTFSSPYEFGPERSGISTPRMVSSASLEAGHTYRFMSRVKGNDASAEVDVWIEDAGTQTRVDEAVRIPAPKPVATEPAAPLPAVESKKSDGSALDNLKKSWQSATPDERADFLKSITSP